MAYEQRDNSGILFKNDRKDSDKHPDYNGNALIAGVEYWISAWIKTGAKGKFMSLAFKPKEDKRGDTRPMKEQLDDEVPF